MTDIATAKERVLKESGYYDYNVGQGKFSIYMQINISPERLDQWLENYLNSKHAVLWGKSFDVVHIDSRQEAKEYIIKLLTDLGVIAKEISGDPLIGANGIDYT
jgi:hypothetical protein